MADLFGRDVKTIGKHINNAVREELNDQVVVAKFATTTQHGAIEGKRFVSRYYRNRRLGDFLKELELSEGHSTGVPTIQEELEKNGSPKAIFQTDEDRRASAYKYRYIQHF